MTEFSVLVVCQRAHSAGLSLSVPTFRMNKLKVKKKKTKNN